MGEFGGGEGFADEAFAGEGGVVGGLVEDLDGDAAAGVHLFGEEDLAHAAAADAGLDAIAAEDEALVAAVAELVRLERGEQAVVDEAVEEVFGREGVEFARVEARQVPAQPVLGHKFALADERDRRVRRGRNRHRVHAAPAEGAGRSGKTMIRGKRRTRSRAARPENPTRSENVRAGDWILDGACSRVRTDPRGLRGGGSPKGGEP